MAARIGIVRFPGTTAAADAADAVRAVGGEPVTLWHTDTELDVDAVLLPGGAAHGDALRPGAVAARTPIMEAVAAFAEAGGAVLGLGNGFQILTEAGLLPGTLRPNTTGRFIARTAEVRIERTDTVITRGLEADAVLRLPIAHGHGVYHGDGSAVFRHVDDPNGAVGDIAGIANEAGNVVGTMLRAERAISPLLGSEDGLPLFRSLLDASIASTS